jgi:hypothetical protein
MKKIVVAAVVVVVALVILGSAIGSSGAGSSVVATPPITYATQLGAAMSDPNDAATCAVVATNGAVATYTCTWATGTGTYGPGNPTDFQTATVLLYSNGAFQLSPGGLRSGADAVFTP